MGLYIEIKGTFPCPTCHTVLSGWQSKELYYDGYSIAILLQQYTLNKKIAGEIHTICRKCGSVAYAFSKGALKQSRR